jgi:hypothetical protein
VLCHYPLWLVGYRRADDELFRAVADKIGRAMSKLFR